MPIAQRQAQGHWGHRLIPQGFSLPLWAARQPSRPPTAFLAWGVRLPPDHSGAGSLCSVDFPLMRKLHEGGGC